MGIEQVFWVQPARPYVIAEIGFNHGGDMDLARRMISAAAAAGADAVKFQTFTAFDLALPSAEHFKLVSSGQLSEEQHRLLSAAASEAGVEFLSTPFSLYAVDLLERVGVPAFKIASMDATNFQLIARAAATGKPLLISTGMAKMDEIKQTLDFVRSLGTDKVVFLHCLSKYPAKAEELNLGAIPQMRAELNVPVGYSDHHPGVSACLAAGMLGAAVIETHFTLDTTWPGGDHSHSADPSMLAELIRDLDHFSRMSGGDGFFRRRPDRDVRPVSPRPLCRARSVSGSCHRRDRSIDLPAGLRIGAQRCWRSCRQTPAAGGGSLYTFQPQ